MTEHADEVFILCVKRHTCLAPPVPLLLSHLVLLGHSASGRFGSQSRQPLSRWAAWSSCRRCTNKGLFTGAAAMGWVGRCLGISRLFTSR